MNYFSSIIFKDNVLKYHAVAVVKNLTTVSPHAGLEPSCPAAIPVQRSIYQLSYRFAEHDRELYDWALPSPLTPRPQGQMSIATLTFLGNK